MTGFEVYKLCLALKNHFKENIKYDYFYHQGKTSATGKSYNKREELIPLYERIGSKYDKDEMIDYFVANLVYGDDGDGDPNAGVYGDLNEGEEYYLTWKRSMQNVTYNYTNQVKYLVDSVDHLHDLFRVTSGENPILLTAHYQGDVSVETFIILNQILNFFPQFSRELDDIYKWPVVRNKCVKYEKFLDIDIQKYTTILKNTLNI